MWGVLMPKDKMRILLIQLKHTEIFLLASSVIGCSYTPPCSQVYLFIYWLDEKASKHVQIPQQNPHRPLP